MNVPRVFTCSICAEVSREICVWCTKDACENHLCRKCGRCSDCCECDVPLEASEAPRAEKKYEPRIDTDEHG